jgi:hypothetical protein
MQQMGALYLQTQIENHILHLLFFFYWYWSWKDSDEIHLQTKSTTTQDESCDDVEEILLDIGPLSKSRWDVKYLFTLALIPICLLLYFIEYKVSILILVLLTFHTFECYTVIYN